MNTIPKFFLFLGLLIFIGCASSIKSKTYIKDDFTNFKTFAYLPNTSFNIGEFNAEADTSIEESLIATMNHKMVEKGFSVDTNNPDLLVLLSTSKEIKTNLENTNTSYVQSPSSGHIISPGGPNYITEISSAYKRYYNNSEEVLFNKPYKKGTLIVQVFSTATKELAWVGIAEDFKAHISDQTLMNRMINEIFKEFPV
ncbi:DUF4136 domain-containing protein [Winogradskyella sp.]|uniref:DUF4136 domain-containing protein n=1 Tax=Winogradskyella sp. TaxID=1883156 RepID=UPI00261B4D43|nr:DUF4136 domain-containing protein [Winogradskyella sp.]